VIAPVCCVPTIDFDPHGIVEFDVKCNLRRKKLHLPDLRIYDNPETPFNYTTFQKYSIRFERFVQNVERSVGRTQPITYI
jgi:hypothetical protein